MFALLAQKFPLDRSATKCLKVLRNEPRHEKTCLRGLRPGKTQTGLLSVITSERRMRKLICAFFCSHRAKTGFLMTRLKLNWIGQV